MKIYRHYKNKFYKYYGLAKHSETLEDLALYDCLYENSMGKTWVRPKELFFGETEVDGKLVPRFQEYTPEIVTYTDIKKEQLEILAKLIKAVFGEWDESSFRETFDSRSKFHLALAYVGDEAAGFKIGFETSQNQFYSWYGGVLEKYRGFGIATQLMELQHSWCKEQGYKRVQTKTKNKFKDMLLLNIKNGFHVTGINASDRPNGTKIILEKSLK